MVYFIFYKLHFKLYKKQKNIRKKKKKFNVNINTTYRTVLFDTLVLIDRYKLCKNNFTPLTLKK